MNYDANGNMIYQENTEKSLLKTISYDSSNRIKEIKDKYNNTIGKYSYDDYGFRVRKFAKSNPKTIEKDKKAMFTELIYPFMYYGMERQLNRNGRIIENTHSAVNNIYLNGIRIASISDNFKPRYYIGDQVDSVKMVLDEQGLILNKFEYYPYGETWITEGEGNNNPKYNSQELDSESNFYFYNARYYDPEIARFVTADNVVDAGAFGWNRYMYVSGNPISYKDPSGHFGYLFSPKKPYFAKKNPVKPLALELTEHVVGKGVKTADTISDFMGLAGLGKAVVKRTAKYAIKGVAYLIKKEAERKAKKELKKKSLKKLIHKAMKEGSEQGGVTLTKGKKNYIFESIKKHGKKSKKGRKGKIASAEPTNAKDMLENRTLELPNNLNKKNKRLVGWDKETGEFAIFDETHRNSGIFHGHQRTWKQLGADVKALLKKQGIVNKKGKIIK